jgi:hypothetical protein
MSAPETYWWELRRPHELTTEYLGRVLDELPVGDMAKRARLGHFSDFSCPAQIADGLDKMRLVNELADHARVRRLANAHRKRILAVRGAVIAGEFDDTKEESDRWAASKDGQETMRMLLGGKEHG